MANVITGGSLTNQLGACNCDNCVAGRSYTDCSSCVDGSVRYWEVLPLGWGDADNLYDPTLEHEFYGSVLRLGPPDPATPCIYRNATGTSQRVTCDAGASIYQWVLDLSQGLDAGAVTLTFKISDAAVPGECDGIVIVYRNLDRFRCGCDNAFLKSPDEATGLIDPDTAGPCSLCVTPAYDPCGGPGRPFSADCATNWIFRVGGETHETTSGPTFSAGGGAYQVCGWGTHHEVNGNYLHVSIWTAVGAGNRDLTLAAFYDRETVSPLPLNPPSGDFVAGWRNFGLPGAHANCEQTTILVIPGQAAPYDEDGELERLA